MVSRRELMMGAAVVTLPRKIRLGLIGFDGHVAEITRPLPELPDVQLVAVANAGSDPSAAKSMLRNEYIARATQYPHYREMLAKEKLDCVAICNNDGERAIATLAAIERGIDFIAEKPFAIQRADLNKIYAGVAAKKLHAGMLLPMRFDPPYLALKQIVDSGQIGEVLQIDAQKSYQLGTRPEWQKNSATYGSTILWIGIHMIDLMTFTSGRKFTQAASFQERVGFPQMRDMQTVTVSIFKLDNGGTATLRMDYLRPEGGKGHGDDRLRLAGTKGVAEYMEATGVTLIDGAPKRQIERLPPAGSVFTDYLRAAYLGAKPALSWDEIVQANEFTMAADDAARLGKIVSIRRS